MQKRRRCKLCFRKTVITLNSAVAGNCFSNLHLQKVEVAYAAFAGKLLLLTVLEGKAAKLLFRKSFTANAASAENLILQCDYGENV